MATKKLQVLFAAFEATPFIKTGGLGDVAGSLPSALKSRSCEVRVILPKLRQIPQKYRDKMETLCVFQVPLGWRNQYCGIQTLKLGKIQYYFVDNEFYFGRDQVYGYGDDCERVAYFSKAVLECLQHLPDFFPDVIHANDWHTALIPVFLREQYQAIEAYQQIRTVYTIHNLKFQGICWKFFLGDLLGLDQCKNAADQLQWGHDAINFLQSALYYSDAITTVSPTYAREICTTAYGEGLEGVLNQRKNRLTGILNGIDTEKYNPSHALFPFSSQDLSGKARCKAALQEELGLPVRPNAPLMVLISRLTDQKGLDLLAGCLGDLLQEDVQVAILGTGDDHYQHLLESYASLRRDRMAVRLTFDEALSQRMYAGADLLLMPSLFEPCGLNQMIAMAYGTLPIVRETGGLRDSVTPYNKYTGEGTGFSFRNVSTQELEDCIHAALRLYWDEPETFEALQHQAMAQDFGWKNSAKQYMSIYRKIRK
jgi:starch synthase